MLDFLCNTLSAIILFIIGTIIGTWIVYKIDLLNSEYDVKLSYHEFLTYYYVAPDQYTYPMIGQVNRKIPGKNKVVVIRFGYIDAVRIDLFMHIVDRNKEKERRADKYMQFLKLVQTDIDALRTVTARTRRTIVINEGGTINGNQENPQDQPQKEAGNSPGQEDDRLDGGEAGGGHQDFSGSKGDV